MFAHGFSVRTSDDALIELARALQRAHYQFTTVTPETHARVERRAARLGAGVARDLRDVFGWNRPFAPELLPSAMLATMQEADVVAREGDLLRSRVRFASLGGQLLVHSAFPTHDADSVFFGPDTYRFCALLSRWAPPARLLVDIGCGTGAGGLSLSTRAQRVVLSDIAPRALRFARINARIQGLHVEVVQSDVLAEISEAPDLIIANPPYMRDAGGRIYRDGGGAHGEGLALRILREGLERLAPGGTLVLYTGAAIVAGSDTFLEAARPVLSASGLAYEYEELDPDVFGDELEQPHYEDVERIAAVGLRVGASIAATPRGELTHTFV